MGFHTFELINRSESDTKGRILEFGKIDETAKHLSSECPKRFFSLQKCGLRHQNMLLPSGHLKNYILFSNNQKNLLK